jgi:hypothetical protein
MTRQELKSILEASGSKFVSVKFTKKDGSERTLLTNPRQVLETLGTGKSSDKVVTIVDAKIGQWRSIRPESILSVKAGGQEIL